MDRRQRRRNFELPQNAEQLKGYRALYYYRAFQYLFLAFTLLIFTINLIINFDSFSVTTTLWGFLTTITILVSLLINQSLLLEPPSKPRTVPTYLSISALLNGILFAICVTFISNHLEFNADHTHIEMLTLVLSTVLILHVASLVLLTHYYYVFLAFFVPSLISLLSLNEITITQQFTVIDFASFALYGICLVILGLMVYRRRSDYYVLVVNNQRLDTDNTLKTTEIDLLNTELSAEKQMAINIREELETNNVLLEQKVKQRTSDIESIHAKLERSHQNLEMAHETAGIASWDWDIAHRQIETSNFPQIFGYNIKNMTHYLTHLNDFIHGEDIDHVKTQMRRHLRGLDERYEATFRVYHPTERWIWVHDLGSVTQRDPVTKKPLRMVGIRRNINNEKKAEESLKLSASVFKKAAQGIFVLDDKLNYVDVNPYYLNLIESTEDQIIGRHVFDILKSSNIDSQRLNLTILRQLMSTGEFEGEIVEELQSGREIPLWMHINGIRDNHDKITQYIGIVTDLTERKASEKRLSYLETYDTLTDLPNRTYFNNLIHSYLTESPKLLNRFAVIRINLDRFRYHNEYLSHHGGDELLKKVANRLRRNNPDAVVIARLNADDFAMILEIKEDIEEIKDSCKKVLESFEAPFHIQNKELMLNVSIGVALYPEHGRQMDSLNNYAEQALLEAKRIGGNTLRIYHNENRLSTAARINLEAEIRRAITHQELSVYYQPKINAHSQTVHGFEALVRWNHPERGVIPPAQFIPLAEETSLITDIGRIVLEQTCSQIKAWENMGFADICVSVNIVVQQIQRGHLVTEVDEIIKKSGIQSHQLELEITETSLMENISEVREVLSDFHKRNIKIALDDFGTGYSSLAYLGMYSFDIIKIDRSFVSKIGQANQDAIVRAIIAMAKAMDKQVVAEGVQTQAQYDFLTAEGCDFLQGFLIAKPMPSDLATEFLEIKRLDQNAHRI
ncbi:PAS domain S-box-containing protein/diguanylate cyclase (GGDEF) domain-containing protein [Acinetobacter marinus]|uniref:cyclic-guanylate-specific phosphodiesterase n=1 Tax=Acinetobacter marinus TaxID=281375 RepID=A0A1G6JU91_9GAMM|nr:GGDEF domain-containing phosphodiesterase [Acinetobacter marinus]SDC22238.1 PAS domain S-box-containing protein/diguanylate cyclase (GGDEF) domain-containing protein [Acinetobacter marinus]